MGNACCAAEEVKKEQKDISDAGMHSTLVHAEESVKGPKKGDVAKEWRITLVKSEGKKLGVDVDLSDGKCLMVDTVGPGLVEDWNKANPSKAVQSEDWIMEVNGTRGQAGQLTEVCKQSDKLDMLIRRPTEEEQKKRRESSEQEE